MGESRREQVGVWGMAVAVWKLNPGRYVGECVDGPGELYRDCHCTVGVGAG